MFAALDLGTNNCRLLIVSSRGSGFRVVDNFNRVVRLGEGVHKTGILSEAAMQRTMVALKHCALRIEKRKSFNLYAVATEACRRASNASSFLKNVQQQTGLSINIISPREEAELALEGCSPFLHDEQLRRDRNRALLFDIGGGSTEIVWVRIDVKSQKQTLIGCCSIPVGVLTLQEQFKELSLENYCRMVEFVFEKMLSFEKVHRIRTEILRGKVQLLGVSGTITTLASLILKLDKYNRSAIDGLLLRTSKVKETIYDLLSHKFNEIYTYPGINKDRANYMMPGCAIFDAIHRLWPVEDIVVADRGLRDGIIAQMIRNKHYKRVSYPQGSNFSLNNANVSLKRASIIQSCSEVVPV